MGINEVFFYAMYLESKSDPLRKIKLRHQKFVKNFIHFYQTALHGEVGMITSLGCEILSDRTLSQRKERQKYSKPVIDKFLEWVETSPFHGEILLRRQLNIH